MEIRDLMLENQVVGKYIEYNPNDFYTKLINASEKGPRRSVKTLCEENNGEIAINGGLFEYSGMYKFNNVVKFIDGVYNSKGHLIHDISDSIPAIVFSKNGDMWADGFSACKGEDKGSISWCRSVAYYCFIYQGNLGCFSKGNALNEEAIVNNYTEKHKRTMIGQKPDRTIVIACSNKAITGKEQGIIMKKLGCVNAFNLDGGGSTHMYDGINKKYIVQGDRNVTDAIVVVKKVKIQPSIETTSNFTMRLHSGETPILDREISGNRRMVVPVKGKIDIIGLYGWPDSNGYRWAWGKRYKTEGAFKYDPRIMIIEGKPIGNYKMKLTGSAARIRESVVNGRIKTTVPNGSEIKILEFRKSVESDGYQWCYGVYNGIYGYFQHDPAVMYPTND